MRPQTATSEPWHLMAFSTSSPGNRHSKARFLNWVWSKRNFEFLILSLLPVGLESMFWRSYSSFIGTESTPVLSFPWPLSISNQVLQFTQESVLSVGKIAAPSVVSLKKKDKGGKGRQIPRSLEKNEPRWLRKQPPLPLIAKPWN